jgi:hypothetical protein
MFPNMKEKIQTEMQELLNEKTVGMDQLARLMQEVEATKMTILRIEGGVAVCRKLLKTFEEPAVPARNGEHQTTAA